MSLSDIAEATNLSIHGLRYHARVNNDIHGMRIVREGKRVFVPREDFDRIFGTSSNAEENVALAVDTEVTVFDHAVGHKARFRLKKVESNGDLTCWGPIDTKGNTPEGKMRTFKQEALARKHRKAKSQETLRANED